MWAQTLSGPFRFEQVDSSDARQKGGTGLGLSIVKHVLQRHDARLDIDSELGRGSRFAARFPGRRLGDGGGGGE